MSELYVNFPAFGFFGNHNLKPEESTGYEIGFEQPLFFSPHKPRNVPERFVALIPKVCTRAEF